MAHVNEYIYSSLSIYIYIDLYSITHGAPEGPHTEQRTRLDSTTPSPSPHTFSPEGCSGNCSANVGGGRLQRGLCGALGVRWACVCAAWVLFLACRRLSLEPLKCHNGDAKSLWGWHSRVAPTKPSSPFYFWPTLARHSFIFFCSSSSSTSSSRLEVQNIICMSFLAAAVVLSWPLFYTCQERERKERWRPWPQVHC